MEKHKKPSKLEIQEKIASMILKVKKKKGVQATAHINCTYALKDKQRARSVLDRLIQLAAEDTDIATVSSTHTYVPVNEEL